ncbi:hypothetical protein GF351_00680 [Candidatus Woesearchaeota archaeon]|nr:hypothetical protein [Candidatus Woesearchaeota archaeon]
MNITCLKCKGRGFCGRSFCPHIAKSEAIFRLKKSMPERDFQGTSPAPFIGWSGYPRVNVGILSPAHAAEDAWLYDAPDHWAANNFQIPQIVEYRSGLINSRQKARIRDKDRLVAISQEVGVSSKPVDVEINLKDRPRFRLNADSMLAPMGPNAEIEKATITSNPHVDTRVDRVVSDNDLKAASALTSLYDKGFGENFLTKVLSVGTLGLQYSRKLVPTRWSITAVDDQLGKHLMKDVKQLPHADYLAFFGSYLGNYYLILVFPDVFSYELFEMYAPKASWNTSDQLQCSTDHESFEGRKDYAHECAGGYYTVRLAVLEHMRKIRRQGACLVLRFITGEYAVPLGVWVTREAARKAMSAKPMEFASRELMLKYAQAVARKKFGVDLSGVLRQSKVLASIRSQTKLTAFA